MFTLIMNGGPSWPWLYGSWIYNYLCNRCLAPPMLWVWHSLTTRNTILCDKVCQWFSPGPPISSINKTNRHDITEILLKVALNTIKPNQAILWLYIVKDIQNNFALAVIQINYYFEIKQNKYRNKKNWRYQRGNQNP
jgi:hypothetical protein